MTCTDAQKRLRGCNGNAELPHLLFGEVLTTCPRRPVFDDPGSFNYWMRMYRNFQLGILPDEGGMNNQAAMVANMMPAMDAAYSAVREQQDEDRAKGKKAKKKPARPSRAAA